VEDPGSTPRTFLPVLVLVVGGFLLPEGTGAQVLQGHIRDDSTRVGVDGASVAILQGNNRVQAAVADTSGWFSMTLPDSGTYRLEARRLGYAAATSLPIFISQADTVTVEFHLSAQAVLMEPLIVIGRRDRGSTHFYERLEGWGQGIFMTPAMVDSIQPLHPADVFRNQEKTWLSWAWGTRRAVPRIRTYLGRGCVMYVLDGRPVREDFWGPTWEDSPLSWINGDDVVAVEFYRYYGEVPPELRRFAQNEDGALCGLAAFWTAVGW